MKHDNTNKPKKNSFFSLGFLKDLKWYEWGIVSMMIAAQLCVAIFDETNVWIAIFNFSMTLSGFLYLVCASRRSFWIFIFGFYQPIAYGLICLNAQVYGEMIINFAYFAPMQIVGLALWLKNLKQSKTAHPDGAPEAVEIKTLKPKSYIWIVPAVVVGFFLMWLMLSQFNGQRLPLLNALVSVGYLLGTLLLTLRYVENWYVYLVTNLLSCALWIILAIQGNGDAFYIFILDVAYLLYTIIGLVKWKKFHKNSLQNTVSKNQSNASETSSTTKATDTSTATANTLSTNTVTTAPTENNEQQTTNETDKSK